jgi:hypothetical protein
MFLQPVSSFSFSTLFLTAPLLRKILLASVRYINPCDNNLRMDKFVGSSFWLLVIDIFLSGFYRLQGLSSLAFFKLDDKMVVISYLDFRCLWARLVYYFDRPLRRTRIRSVILLSPDRSDIQLSEAIPFLF